MSKVFIDAIFFSAGTVFAVTGWLATKKGTRIPLYASLPTAIALLADIVAFALAGLYLSAVITGVTTVAWFFLAAKRRLKKGYTTVQVNFNDPDVYGTELS